MGRSAVNNPGGLQAHVRRYQHRASSGVVAFRFDDAPVTDLPLAWLLGRQGISVELAVPAAFVGKPRRLRRGHLRALLRAGHTVANHSYAHGPAPTEMSGLAAELRRADEWFEANGVRTLSFVQPGPWSAGGPGSLDTPERAAALSDALGGRYLCLEGYASQPVLPGPSSAESRFGLSHVTLDGMTWPEIQLVVTRAVEERGFVEFVAHTARCLRLRPGILLGWRLLKLARLCSGLERQGRLVCRSVIAGLWAHQGEGRSLVDGGAVQSRGESQAWRFVEPLVPGMPYRFEWRSGEQVPARREKSARILDPSTGAGFRLRLRRFGGSLAARFGVPSEGAWELRTTGLPPGGPGSIAVHVA